MNLYQILIEECGWDIAVHTMGYGLQAFILKDYMNGYVAVPHSHPWFNLSAEEIPFDREITFEKTINGWKLFGFDTKHSMDKPDWRYMAAKVDELLKLAIKTNK